MKLFALLLGLVLGGCASLDAYKAVAVQKVAQVNDKIGEDAELATCRGLSIGWWLRHYGSSPQLASAWRTICGLPETTELPTEESKNGD